jgi:hypothetical protein
MGVCRDEGATCSNGTCQRQGFPNNPCALISDCSVFYTCDINQGHCTPPPTLGGDCTNGDCPVGSYCMNAVLGANTCTPYTADNAPCMEGVECASGRCVGPDLMQTCAPIVACD